VIIVTLVHKQDVSHIYIILNKSGMSKISEDMSISYVTVSVEQARRSKLATNRNKSIKFLTFITLRCTELITIDCMRIDRLVIG